MTKEIRPGYGQQVMLADRWKDYQLIDTGDGMKLERWGDVILVRPDPQVIWPRQARSDWNTWDGFYHRSESGGGRWEFRRQLPESWAIHYQGMTFKIRPTDFKHTGLFPEQAANWDWCSQKIQMAGKRDKGREIHVLNLFGYTGAATVACATAGAQVCHVDASKGMVNWCRENADLSGLSTSSIRYIADDCLKFVHREAKRGRKYDAIIMDPPTYGRGSSGEIWKLEVHLWKLLQECAPLLSDHPLFFLINSYTNKLSPLSLGNLLTELFQSRAGMIQVGELGLPSQRNEKILPCGVFGRWENSGSCFKL
jgi:23S rRNA (cytosine1962-C5)-methyltransferase